MPFIRGRYHINPVMGEALEAAREAEEALLALEQGARSKRAGGCDDDDDMDGSQGPRDPRPVHRIEIETAEVVPSHAGRGTRGFVTQVHRAVPGGGIGAGGRVLTSPPETHVFSSHEDLVNFLGDELSHGDDAIGRVPSQPQA